MSRYREWTLDEIRRALSYIDSDERIIWITVGGGLKGELGDSGLAEWLDWSSSSSRYKEADARKTWPTFKALNMGAIYNLAKTSGFKRDDSPPLSAVEKAEYAAKMAIRREADAERRKKEAHDVAVKKEDKQVKLDAVIANSWPLTATNAAGLYLKRRHIFTGTESPDLRFVAKLEYLERVIREDGSEFWFKGEFPAMIALMRDLSGIVVGLQRFYLADDGRKAEVPVVKKTMVGRGTIKGSAVKLAPIKNGLLGIAEGVETALAASVLTGVPVWAAISAGNVEAFAIPPEVRRLIVFGDFDETGVGQRVAKALVERAREAGIVAVSALPTDIGFDWNDVQIAAMATDEV